MDRSKTFELYKHELCVLAHLFAFPGKIQNNHITSDDFSNRRYHKLFVQLQKLIKKQKEFPSSSIVIKEVGRLANENVEDILEAENWSFPYHLGQVRMIRKMEEIRTFVQTMPAMDEEEIDKELGRLASTCTSVNTDVLFNVVADFDRYIQMSEEKRKLFLKGQTPWLTTSFQKIDRHMRLQPGRLAILAARPSVGKSSLAINMATAAAIYGAKVLYVTLEMTECEVLDRITAFLTGQPISERGYETKVVQNVRKEIEGCEFEIAYTSGATVGRVLAIAAPRDLDLVVIDHMDLLDLKKERGETEATAIGRVTAALKNFSRINSTCVLALSQFNRESKGKFPQLHELRGSGAKEQDADVVAILHRELDPDSAEPAKLRIAKNRTGPVGDVLLSFDPSTTTFKEYYK